MSRNTNLLQTLSCATAALLGVTMPACSVAETTQPWDINVGLMTYAERDRNTGVEFLLDASRLLANNDRFTLGIELDALTGATPNGATATNQAQTFTQSSGDGSYQVPANALPADDTHMDTRLSVDAGYQDQRGSDLAIDYGARISMEFDYLSFGLSNGYTLELNQKTTSLYLGLNSEYNMVHPVGNVPDAFALMTPEDTEQNRNRASITRSLLEVAIGLTQIINERSLFQLRYTRSQADGYLTDPYKILSIINDDTEADDLIEGESLAYRYERRPSERDTNTLYFAYKYHFDSGVLSTSLRHTTDTWDVSANALNIAYRYSLDGGAFIEPSVRFYRQNEASFFRHSLPSSEELPEFATADTRLGNYDAWTIGLRYGSRLSNQSQFTVGVDYYQQDGESFPADAIGLQLDQDLFPTLEALVMKITYKTQW